MSVKKRVRRAYRRLNFVLLYLLFILFVIAHPALAIGPGTGGSKIRVSDERIGPYVLLVATSPLPVTVGQMSVWVRVTDGKTGQTIPDAEVIIKAAPLEGNNLPIIAQATHKNAGNDTDYVAHIEVKNTGQWAVTVSIKDKLGEAETSFTETVTRGLSMGLLIGLAVPFVVLAIVVGIYLWRRSAAAS